MIYDHSFFLLLAYSLLQDCKLSPLSNPVYLLGQLCSKLLRLNDDIDVN